jgi:histidine ammonia-lyase
VNPLVSGLPAFLAHPGGTRSGFMIAQYTAASLVAQNRREAAPASLDGGVTSGLQEDHLCHATPAALKALAIIENSNRILGIELLAAAQAYDLQPLDAARAPYTDALYASVRASVPTYRDDRPLSEDMTFAFRVVANGAPPPLSGPGRGDSTTATREVNFDMAPLAHDATDGAGNACPGTTGVIGV